MSVTSILKNDPTLVSRYMADQLTDAERAMVEQQIVDDPAVLREFEATARFKLGLHSLRRTGRLNGVVEDRPPRTPWLLSAAAAAILVLTIGMLRWSSEQSSTLAANLSALVNERGAILPLGGTYAVFRKRGGNYDAVVRLPETRQAVELRVLPDFDGVASPPYKASLARINHETEERPESISNLIPAADGFVSIFVDSGRVATGDYVLDVSDADAMPGMNTTFKIKLYR